METLPFDILVGKTLSSVVGSEGGETLIFTTEEGEKYQQFHRQDCCEFVRIEEIHGELKDLIGSPILYAREDTNEGEGPYSTTYTWTFYNIGTAKGHVTVRWLGESNGYYSESVDFVRLME